MDGIIRAVVAVLALVPRWLIGLIGVALVPTGVVLGACFATQTDDGTPVAEEGTPVPTAIPRQSAPGLSPSPPPSPHPAASPTPTPEPGVCPPAYRRVAAVPNMLGGRMEGGTSFQQGYLTLHLPAGREFVLSTGWSSPDGLSFSIYDVGTQSALHIRGDGCETGRIVGDAAADTVFDEIMATLEVGNSYACPSPKRVTPDDFPGTEEAPALSQIGGQSAKGGAPLRVGDLTLHLPAGRDFRLGGGVSDPGGSFLWLYDMQTQSYVYLRPDGCETSRFIRDPAADAVLDEIVATLEVER